MDFQKLGLDRIAQNIARSVNSPTGTLTTGDITRGDVVTVQFPGTTEASAKVKARRTGAILIDNPCTTADYRGHTISGGVLTVKFSGNISDTLTFWVF